MAGQCSGFLGLKYGSCHRLRRKPCSLRAEIILAGSGNRDSENLKSQRCGTSNHPVSMWTMSQGISYWRNFFATSRTSSSEQYVWRPIHSPNDHKGGIGLRPVRAVYSERISLGVP